MTEPDSGPRPPSPLRVIAVAALVALLILVAFVAGAALTAALGLTDRLQASSERTVVRPGDSVVTAVRELARLESSSWHVERVIDLSEEQARLWGALKVKDSLLLVAAADVTAGVDLGRLADGAVVADPDARSVTLTLPQPQVFATVLDNARTYVHSRTTEMLADRKEDLESRARQQAEATLRQAALDAGILEHARESAERSLTTLLRALGYERVEIAWQR